MKSLKRSLEAKCSACLPYSSAASSIVLEISRSAKILAGSADASVQDYRSLSTYGLLSDYSIKSVTGIIDYLIAENYIAQETGFRPSIYVTSKGEMFLKERPEIEIPGVSRPA